MVNRSVALRGLWAVSLLSLLGCHVMPRMYVERSVPRVSGGTPIARALQWLENTQTTAVDERLSSGYWAGTWPMYVQLGPAKVIDFGSGLSAYVHGSLQVICERHASALELSQVDLSRARRMRRRAMAFMERFRRPGPRPSAYGWWPPGSACVGGEHLLARLLEARVRGPKQWGTRAPLTIPAFPSSLRAGDDVDDTALVLMAHKANTALDGGARRGGPIAPLFTPWRDLPGMARSHPRWLPRGSGAFLTWMVPSTPRRAPNDVDLVINANVLWALAAHGELGVLGVDDAIRAIVRAAHTGRSRCERDVTPWYPRRMFHYAVARAWDEGPVPALATAVHVLSREIAREARVADGRAWWGPSNDRGERAYQTAVSVLTLIHARHAPHLVRAGCRTLVALQDRRTGGWGEAALTWADTRSGDRIIWRSAAMPTGLAMEALARARIVGWW